MCTELIVQFTLNMYVACALAVHGMCILYFGTNGFRTTTPDPLCSVPVFQNKKEARGMCSFPDQYVACAFFILALRHYYPRPPQSQSQSQI